MNFPDRTNTMNPSILSKRYKKASEQVLEKYPTWKKKALLEDLSNKVDNRFTVEYSQAVVALAENEEISFSE